MKITSEHIGKKVRWDTWDSEDMIDYVIVQSISGSEIKGVTIFNDKVKKGCHWTQGDDWRFYDSSDVFDFSRFGCNEEAVRDLVKVLDKRYGIKEGM